MSHLDDEELDALLAKELEHDPGEAYFASFADRVAARIAAETAAAQPVEAPAPRAGLGAWFGTLFTPRGLAFAGGTLALLVVVGIAYNTSQRGGAPPAAMLQESPVIPSEPTQSSDTAESLSDAAAPDAAAPVGAAAAKPEAAAKSIDAPRQVPPSRMYEVRPGANGEDVPVRPRASSPRPTLAPIPGESDQARAKRELNAQPMRGQTRSEEKVKQSEIVQSAPTPMATAPVPAPAAAAERRGGMQPARDEDVVAAKELSVTDRLDSAGQLCGTVRDASGRAVAGARVTLTSDGKGASTDASGAFCLPSPKQAGTLSVLAVGFRESRLTVGPSSTQALAVTLNAVDPLAKGNTQALDPRTGATALGSDPKFRGGRGAESTFSFTDPARKLNADPYARESAPARAAAAFAREAQKAAEKTPSTEAWTVAGERWSLVASLVRGEEAVPDARFQAAKARYASWELGPDDRRQRHAREAVDAFLAIATNGPLRELALGWKAKLGR